MANPKSAPEPQSASYTAWIRRLDLAVWDSIAARVSIGDLVAPRDMLAAAVLRRQAESIPDSASLALVTLGALRVLHEQRVQGGELAADTSPWCCLDDPGLAAIFESASCRDLADMKKDAPAEFFFRLRAGMLKLLGSDIPWAGAESA